MNVNKLYFNHNLNIVTQKQYDAHFKLYEGYIDKVNEINTDLSESPDRKKANATYSYYRGLKKGQTYALNGVILHEEYFRLIEAQKSTMGIYTLELINRCFGTFENWKEDFTACAKSARGWCITSFDQRTKCIYNFVQDLHDEGVITMSYPMIVLDMYEHAYFMDYGVNKDEYIRRFIDYCNWEAVESKAKKIPRI